MNEYEEYKQQLQTIEQKRIRLQLLKEQAEEQCKKIEKKYNITSKEQLKELLEKAKEEYEKTLDKAKSYIDESSKVFEELGI